MTSHLLANSETGVFPAHDKLARQLDQAFGTSFCYWVPDEDRWRPVDGGFATADSRVFADAEALVAAAAVNQTAGISVSAHGECLLAVPLHRCDERNVVATARFSDMPAEVVQRQADLYLDAVSARLENVRLTNINTSLTMQVMENLEELVFLRSMATHLVLEVHGVRLGDIIRMILPSLCATLRAENVALVVPAERKVMLVGDDVLWASDELLEKSRLLTLCDEMRDRAVNSTVVENHFPKSDFAESYPEIRGLISVEVGDNAEVGWLIAINRVLPAGVEQADWLSSEHQFGTVEAVLMASAAAMLATHFHNVELLHQKEELFTEVVRALVNAVEAKDAYLCGHSERVALFSQRLAQQINLDEESCNLLYLSGLLHDVGKIAISDTALHKPGSLTSEEVADLNRHPDEAWAILHDLEHFREILPGVLHHHERYDGEGYPDGLAGQAIPLEGRIMAICDAFDAMTSDRSYRRGMSTEKAGSILRAGAGTQWDSNLIDEFLAILPEINDIRRSYHPRTRKRRREAK